MIIDICVFSVMLAVTVVFKIPNNLLLIDLVFFAWTLLGNVVGYSYPKFWEWLENQYLKRHGIPHNKKDDLEESGSTFVCRLLYFTIELGLIVIFCRAVVLNLIEL